MPFSQMIVMIVFMCRTPRTSRIESETKEAKLSEKEEALKAKEYEVGSVLLGLVYTDWICSSDVYNRPLDC